MNHIVALSGGKDSTAMALRLAEIEPRDYQFVCTPTGDELPEMFEHWKRLGSLLGKPVIPVSGGTLDGLIKKWNAVPNFRARWCTRVLKIEPYRRWLADRLPAVSYVGIRADEIDIDPETVENSGRKGIDYSDMKGISQRFPMAEWGWTLQDVRVYLKSRGISVPRRTDCAACFYQTLGEWYLLWKDYPREYQRSEHYEEMTGHHFRSDGRDSWPARLKDLRGMFERGHQPKSILKARQQRLFDTDPITCRPRMCSFCAR